MTLWSVPEKVEAEEVDAEASEGARTWKRRDGIAWAKEVVKVDTIWCSMCPAGRSEGGVEVHVGKRTEAEKEKEMEERIGDMTGREMCGVIGIGGVGVGIGMIGTGIGGGGSIVLYAFACIISATIMNRATSSIILK